LQAKPSLLDSAQFKERFELLDQLDAALAHAQEPGRGEGDLSVGRLRFLRSHLEETNAALCCAARTMIQQGIRPALVDALVAESHPASGLSFDYLDEFVAGILALQEPDLLPAHPPQGMVFYQPTPARHIFDLLRQTNLSEKDVFIDLGSGLGHVPLLAAICTSARCVGIEREEGYVRSAIGAASALHLDRVVFFEQDARQADLSSGTVFYLYTPFTGSILAAVLHGIRQQSAHSRLRICTFGPCTEVVARESWLEAVTAPDSGHITVFSSRTCASV
jgi:hypothetical protein